MSAVSRVIVMTSALVRSELLTAAPSDRAALNQGKPWDQKVRICMRQIVRKLREATRPQSRRPSPGGSARHGPLCCSIEKARYWGR